MSFSAERLARLARRCLAAATIAVASCVPDARTLAPPATFDCGVFHPRAHVSCRSLAEGAVVERTTPFDTGYALRPGAETFERFSEPRCPILDISCPKFVPEGYRGLGGTYSARCGTDAATDTTAAFRVEIEGESVRQCSTTPGAGTSAAVDPEWAGTVVLPGGDDAYEIRVTTSASIALPTCRLALDDVELGAIPMGEHVAGVHRVTGGRGVPIALECDPAPRDADHDGIGGFVGGACYGYACEDPSPFAPVMASTKLAIAVVVESL